MPKRMLFYLSKSDPAEWIVRVLEPTLARADADNTLGVANWAEYDLTPFLRSAVAALVNAARDRVGSPDGSGRWRLRTVADVIKGWLGEPPDHVCPACDQATAIDVGDAFDGLRRAVNARDEEITRLRAELAATELPTTG